MATYATVDAITQRLIRLSGQVPGVSVQVYSTDIFYDMINTTMRMIARKYWWPHLMKYFTGLALDGVTGVLTTDLSGVQDHTDIKSIYYDDCGDPLTYAGENINATKITGDKPIFYTALPMSDALYLKRLIIVYPVTATADITIRARIVPDTVLPGNIVPLDQDLIVFGVLWSFFEDEGDNPQQASKYKALFDAKFTELVTAMSNHRVPLGSDANYDSGYREVY